MPNLLMGMRNLMEDTKKKLEMARSGGSKLENERRLNEPSLERSALVSYLRAKAQQNKPNLPTTDMGLSKNMPDWMKPQFRINSLDRQNNDPLRTGSIDSYRGNTDIKPLPSATFSGSVSKIPNLTLQ
jgi:hypothetical protein